MSREIQEIRIDDIAIGEYEQRVSYEDDDIGAIAASITRVGLIYPIIVKLEDGKHVLVEGHRRYLAHRMLGRDTINCLIYSKDEVDQREISFAGNFFRKDLSPIELAAAISDAYKHGDLSIEQIAQGFHKKPEWVRRMIAILDWPEDVQQAVHERFLSVSAAHNLALVTDEVYRKFLIDNAVQGGVTARTTASWLQAWRAMQPAEVAITSEPVGIEQSRSPAVPQAPCFCCAQSFDVDQVSHVPICSACIQILREVGKT